MKRVKGCLNSTCSEYRKTYFKASNDICPKCGAELSCVCKHHGCFKQLPIDSKEKLCPIHLAEKQDSKDKLWDGVKKVGVPALGLAASLLLPQIFNKKE